ncbi:MAG: histidine phosphatase family protein [Pseudomonadota bacterium]|nr:histidine phosphatase family protein [Pseudomonadota bacterium]
MPRQSGEASGSTRRAFRMALALITHAAWLSLTALFATPAAFAGPDTHVYILRHAEADGRSPKQLLNDAGRARAEMLGDRFRKVEVTHVFATSTSRSFESVTPLARRHGLSVRRIPAPGSSVDGRIVVLDRGDPRIAIGPMLDTLRALPPGSTAVVGTDSASLFAIMAGLGVDIRHDCPNYASCVPCGHGGCFPESEFDNLWLVIPDRDAGEAISSRIRYGDPLELLTGFRSGKRTRDVDPALMEYD